MKKKSINLFTGAFIATALLLMIIAACKKEEKTVTPAPPSNEFLTTGILTAINVNAPYDTVVGKYKVNPDNTVDTSHATMILHTNTTYHVKVTLLDESKTPVVDITSEIRDRANYHLFCWTVDASIGSNLTVTRTDLDTNNPPLQVGLNDDFKTGSTAMGTLEMVMRHQPNVKNGQCEPGSTDFDAFYTIKIQ